ncbi:MAG: biotin transporter BioY [Oscillospiraceae bacterium]|jgi:biotin transport system substrate-specific component|nr:biotin transporter BioY [Oscillospiraceae bacterium]MCI9548856.1 biotin transporter BioY [Oscillospiraceae bacterium]
MSVKTAIDTRRLTLCAVMAAVMCVLAPISVPIGPISITGGTLAIYLTACLLGGRWGAVTTLVYLLLGFVGLPVFSNYMGGAERLLGPTGGYLVGYLPMMLIAGGVVELTLARFREKGRAGAAPALVLQFLGMVLATAVLYAFGTAWYCVQAGVGLEKALAACVFPFIPFDLVKMAIALLVGVPVRRGLERARLL